MTWKTVHVSQTSSASPSTVCAFAGDPANLPLWAAGLSAGIRRVSDRWVADSPMGQVEVAFTGPIDLGILDHDVTLPDGTVVHNPVRVLRNDVGAEIVFTAYQRDGMTDAEFESDVATVRADLARLRDLLEAAGQ